MKPMWGGAHKADNMLDTEVIKAERSQPWSLFTERVIHVMLGFHWLHQVMPCHVTS